MARLETLGLHLLGDREPELDELDAVLVQHVLELGNLLHEPLVLTAACRSPFTGSTTARLYQLRSKNTISPGLGSCFM